MRLGRVRIVEVASTSAPRLFRLIDHIDDLCFLPRALGSTSQPSGPSLVKAEVATLAWDVTTILVF